MMMASKSTGKKRKCLTTLETKAMLIEEVDKKIKTKAEICRLHAIASSTLDLHTILKDRETIMVYFIISL